jgi:hypothetical protein
VARLQVYFREGSKLLGLFVYRRLRRWDLSCFEMQKKDTEIAKFGQAQNEKSSNLIPRIFKPGYQAQELGHILIVSLDV